MSSESSEYVDQIVPGAESPTEDDAGAGGTETLDREAALRKAYGSATKALREQHREDFNTLYAAHAKDLGHEWTPKPTAEEVAKQQLEAIYKDHPNLRPPV